MPDPPLLQISDLTLTYGRRSLLNKLSFSIKHGEMVAVLGESGAGKSLLLRVILDLLPQEISLSGKIMYGGQPLHGVISKLRGNGIAYVPQDPVAASFPLRTIRSQWAAICEARGRSFEIKAAEDELSGMLLPHPRDILNSYPHQLSGGELQRVWIAMALSGNPSLLLADEPSTALDTVSQREVLQLIRKNCIAKGIATLLVTHDLAVARHVCERVLVLKNGAIVEDGNSNTVLTMPANSYIAELLHAYRKMYSVTTAKKETCDQPLLELRGFNQIFKKGSLLNRRSVIVAKNVSLPICQGMITGLAGISGAGKTTLLRTFTGLDEASRPFLYYRGKPLHSLSASEYRHFRKKVQVIFQNPGSSLNPRMNAREVLMEAIELGETKYSLSVLLDWVKLSAIILDLYPAQLSGGEKQRLNIARSLALQPEILLCDEPTSSLDQMVQADLLELFLYLKKEINLGVLIISHNLASLRKVSDLVAIIDSGEIKEFGPTEKVLERPISPYTRQLLQSEPTLSHDFLTVTLDEQKEKA